MPKGDVLATARLAGIMAAKRTHELIPLCHPLPLERVRVDLEPTRRCRACAWTTEARLHGRTGVEMEALIAAAVAALTVYDMCKAVDRGMEVAACACSRRAAARAAMAPTGERRSAMSAPHRGRARRLGERRRREGHAQGRREARSLRVDHGIEGDAHAGPWHRQVSLLARESIEKMRATGSTVGPGDFAENLTTGGIVVTSCRSARASARRRRGRLEVTQIGKECHDRCAIYRQAGDCVMPREGIFARVLEGGVVRAGDGVVLLKQQPIGPPCSPCATPGRAASARTRAAPRSSRLLNELGVA